MQSLNKRQLDSRGITMIELVIGMAILSVVGVMAVSFLSFSVRMYHFTSINASLQTESQMVSRRISDVIMGAQNIYLDETEDSVILFTGVITVEDNIMYHGEIFWFDKKTSSMYQNSFISVKATGTNGTLTSADVEKAILEGMDTREFLISDKIKALDFSIFPQLKEADRIKKGSDFYILDKGITIYYTLTLGYLDSEDYVLCSGTTPRNKIGFLRVSEFGENKAEREG